MQVKLHLKATLRTCALPGVLVSAHCTSSTATATTLSLPRAAHALRECLDKRVRCVRANAIVQLSIRCVALASGNRPVAVLAFDSCLASSSIFLVCASRWIYRSWRRGLATINAWVDWLWGGREDESTGSNSN